MNKNGIAQHFTRGFLAGMFIALGGLVSIIVSSGDLPYGLSRLLAGVAFSVGLIMSFMANASLFTGSCAYICKHIDNRVSPIVILSDLAKTWIFNFIGTLFVALVVYPIVPELASVFTQIGVNKVSLTVNEMIYKGIMCNLLVCLAVILSTKTKSFTDLLVAIGIPVSVFVICGFEHSVANMFFLPMAKMCGAPITLSQTIIALLAVTLGNFLGGMYISMYAASIGEFHK